jgi:hypothetical protein
VCETPALLKQEGNDWPHLWDGTRCRLEAKSWFLRGGKVHFCGRSLVLMRGSSAESKTNGALGFVWVDDLVVLGDDDFVLSDEMAGGGAGWLN